MKNADQLEVLMISLDPDFVDPRSDVYQRHLDYSRRIKFLNILILGGVSRTEQSFGAHGRLFWTGSKGLLGLIRGLKLAKSIVKNNQIDLIDCQDPHATGWIGWRLKKEYGLPLEVHYHGDFWDNRYWLKEAWKNIIFNHWQERITAAADGIRVVSQGIKDKLIQAGFAADKVHVINTPINSLYFEQPEASVKRTRTFLFVGRLEAAKNIFFMLECLRQLWQAGQDFDLIMIGQGSLGPRLKKWIAGNDLTARIKMIDKLPPEQLIGYYRQSRALLLLSTNESFGKVIVEAGLQGLPTVASRTIGAEAIIRDNETGWLVPINDRAATIKTVEGALKDEKIIEKMIQQTRLDFMQRFDSQQTATSIISLWQAIA